MFTTFLNLSGCEHHDICATTVAVKLLRLHAIALGQRKLPLAFVPLGLLFVARRM